MALFLTLLKVDPINPQSGLRTAVGLDDEGHQVHFAGDTRLLTELEADLENGDGDIEIVIQHWQVVD
jgi:hypothetical protein